MIKKLLLGTMLISNLTQAQTLNGAHLDINNIKAQFNPDGSLFTGPGLSQQFEVPKGSARHTIYAGGLWIGGIDAGSVLRTAAMTYRQMGTDFWTGPLDMTGAYDSVYGAAMDRVWKLNKCDINAWYDWKIGGSVGPSPVDSAAQEAIMTWPAFNAIGTLLGH
jgi:hypothetical protein